MTEYLEDEFYTASACHRLDLLVKELAKLDPGLLRSPPALSNQNSEKQSPAFVFQPPSLKGTISHMPAEVHFAKEIRMNYYRVLTNDGANLYLLPVNETADSEALILGPKYIELMQLDLAAAKAAAYLNTERFFINENKEVLIPEIDSDGLQLSIQVANPDRDFFRISDHANPNHSDGSLPVEIGQTDLDHFFHISGSNPLWLRSVLVHSGLDKMKAVMECFRGSFVLERADANGFSYLRMHIKNIFNDFANIPFQVNIKALLEFAISVARTSQSNFKLVSKEESIFTSKVYLEGGPAYIDKVFAKLAAHYQLNHQKCSLRKSAYSYFYKMPVLSGSFLNHYQIHLYGEGEMEVPVATSNGNDFPLPSPKLAQRQVNIKIKGPIPPGIFLSISAEGKLSKVKKLLGVEDILLNNPILDPLLLIRSHDKEFAKAILDKAIQDIIEKLPKIDALSIYIQNRNKSLETDHELLLDEHLVHEKKSPEGHFLIEFSDFYTNYGQFSKIDVLENLLQLTALLISKISTHKDT